MKTAVTVCTYDEDGDPVLCTNRKYMGGIILSPVQKCGGCEHEVQDLFTGTAGKQVWAWYCVFIPGGGGKFC
jgi:hypothetical protein